MLIPHPAELTAGTGHFTFDPETRIVATNAAERKLAGLLTEKLSRAAGFSPRLETRAPRRNFLRFTTDDSLPPEAYTLEISEKSIELRAGAYAGLVHGLQTIRQLLPPAIEGNRVQAGVSWQIPSLRIRDEPRFPWRGLMLDVSRHFFGKDYVLATLDRMALFKLNTLHLHLVDDQGWRLEIKGYPRLTEVGAYRVDQEDRHWDARLKNGPADEATYGDFYTQEDIREIVAYARDRGITVVPEIEMPAHVMSALAAYPEFSCHGEPIAVPSGGVWPITDIYCPGKEATFGFLEEVLLEVMELFPSRYLHVGGDEATRTNWEVCEDCQRRMREEGLESTAELQSYFIRRMERFVSAHGRVLIGWDEILEGGLAPGAAVMSWRGTEGGWEASRAGHDVVMTPGDYVYLNQYQGDPDYEPLAFGGYVPLSKVYSFDPLVDSMSTEQQRHVLGGQANLWSEFIADVAGSEYMLYPRLAALAEVLWTPRAAQRWERFSGQLPELFGRLEAMGVNYSRSAYAVTAASELSAEKDRIRVALQSEVAGADIRYALGEEALTAASRPYTTPLELDRTTTVRAAVFADGQPAGDPLTKTFTFHRAVGKPVAYAPVYHAQYPGREDIGLVNILRGSKNFHDGQWQGWLVDDVTLTIDLDEVVTVSSVAVGTMENQGSGIFFPQGVKVAVSTDGVTYQRVGEYARDYARSGEVRLDAFAIEFAPRPVRYLRIAVDNLGHPPQGGSAWMFLDEVIVK
ncbi:beta-N-acetylhexosaminidase [Neolewinella marina]|uniref:beta-N-acetylhexosaminidase n=2 Tax=Neolewinella marina TaxID=438751 RepID=A0A2G0CCS5_9BACT|nr:beta-N-acetylhexosaminidase [Neolewinella marina]